MKLECVRIGETVARPGWEEHKYIEKLNNKTYMLHPERIILKKKMTIFKYDDFGLVEPVKLKSTGLKALDIPIGEHAVRAIWEEKSLTLQRTGITEFWYCRCGEQISRVPKHSRDLEVSDFILVDLTGDEDKKNYFIKRK